jgi:hypothetical protein
MDPRLEYTFQLLIDTTGLPRGDVMDYIFDGNMVCLLLHSNIAPLLEITSEYRATHIHVFTPYFGSP